jgi:phenylalanyl-tRNA synthetase beta chain
MKISYNWLKDYLKLNIEPFQLADRLSLVGFEVEEVLERKFDFPNVVVGQVLQVEAHPNSDKLKICKVTTGEEELSIICGAPNVDSGQVVAVAKLGAILPNGLKIHKAKIRNIESNGMICSQAELGLEDNSEGIWVLPDTLPVGVPLDKAMEMETDYIFDIAVTPNRPDCLSHLGIAREVAALSKQKFSKPLVKFSELSDKASDHIQIKIDSPDGCPRYSARMIRDVKIGESPGWLVRRLEAVGMRSVNNVVDITNFVLMETGHPLHAFDYDLIKGKKIIVRESHEGELFTTLDDKERELKKGTILICDAENPVAIGGIMGGLNSEVTNDTKNILLESAYFDPESIQISSRYLGLSTEASQRFERGADPNGTIYAMERAVQLIAELAGGKIYKGVVDAYPKKHTTWNIPLDTAQINNLLGTSLSKREMQNILESLELKVEEDEVIIPTFRPDLHGVADLAEEIARHHGLDNIQPQDQFPIDYDVQVNFFDLFIDRLKNELTGLGLQEVITSSMVSNQLWENISGNKLYPIMNPISTDLDVLRNSLIPSLAQVVQYNRNRKILDLKLFEINRIFLPPANKNELPVEEVHLAIALSGRQEGSGWTSSQKSADFYDIKGLIEVICHKISLDNWQFISYSDSVIQQNGLAITVHKELIGKLGRLDLQLLELFEIDTDVFVAELNVRKLFDYRQVDKKYKPILRFPAVERDLAFIVDEQQPAQDLVNLISKKGGSLLTDIEIFDVFRGKQIPEGTKSIAIRLNFQSPDKTLTEDEVNVIMERIITGAEKTFQAKLRD